MADSISIGAQGGGPETHIVGHAKVGLYHALKKHVTDTHCDAIDEYGLVLRVDGSIQKFGPEGITRLRLAKKKRYITVDIQIPEPVWRPLGPAELKLYLSKQVKAAVEVCVSRLKKDGYRVDSDKLMFQIDQAISEYTRNEN
jgi:hypothetical protein